MPRYTLIIVFLIALLVRIIYAIAAPAVYLFNADTVGYYDIGVAFFSHPSVQTLITPYRTPVYPLFLNAVMHVIGAGSAPFASPAFLWGSQFVTALQMIIGAVAFTAFYQILTRLVPTRARVLFAVFLLLDVFVIGWERTLLTEGLAISVSLMITTVLLHILVRPSVKKFILLWLLFVFGFLLRPSFAVYPAATLPVVAWYFRKQSRIVFLTCMTLAATIIVPLAYARINYANYGYSGIQYVGDINILGRILGFNLPIESAKNYSYFYTTVTDARAKYNFIPTGFQFLRQYDSNIWDKAYRFVELQGFNRTVIMNNLPAYAGKALTSIPDILLQVCDFTLVSPSSKNLPTQIVWWLQQAYGYSQYITLAVPFLWIPACIIFLVKPTRWNAIVALIGTIATSQILLTAFVVYKDIGGQYGRVLSVVQPHMYLFLVLCAITCLRMYQNHRI